MSWNYIAIVFVWIRLNKIYERLIVKNNLTILVIKSISATFDFK